jgi:hypothetical protein
LLDALLNLACTDKIGILGKYNGKKICSEIERTITCPRPLLSEVGTLGAESRFILVVFLLHFQKALDNGYKQEALVNFLQLLVHIEKRFGDPDISLALFRTRKEKLIMTDISRLNIQGDKL